MYVRKTEVPNKTKNKNNKYSFMKWYVVIKLFWNKYVQRNNSKRKNLL